MPGVALTDHRSHGYNYIFDLFDKYQHEIDDHLHTVKQQLSLVFDALHDLDTQQEQIAAHGESVKNEIDALMASLVQAIQQSGARLKQTVDSLIQCKLNSISRQKEGGQILLSQLRSCERYVQDKLNNGSQQEILQEKNEMMERFRAVSQQLTLQQLHLKEKADVVFHHSHDILEKCSEIGKVSVASARSTTNAQTIATRQTSGHKVAYSKFPGIVADVSVVFTTTLTITHSAFLQSFDMENFGLKVEIPPDAVPRGKQQIVMKLEVLSINAGNIDPSMEMVSCLYRIEPSHQFTKPVTLHIQHCAQLNNKEDCKDLLFTVSHDEKLPYTFEEMAAPQTFTPHNNYGSVKISNFSKYMYYVVLQRACVHQMYYACGVYGQHAIGSDVHVSMEKYTWILKIAVTKRLAPYIQVYV